MLVKVAIAIIFSTVSGLATKHSVHSLESRIAWTRIQLYALVLLSLALSIVLNALGYVIKNRRGKTWVASLTRLGYFLGDLAATAALTTLFKLQSLSRPHAEVVVFWVPFLLSHIGSVETTAANFLEEKKLWRLYMLGFIIQFGMAGLIYARFWGYTDMAYIALPVFISGFIKCGERLLILMFSGFDYFKTHGLSGNPRNRSSLSRPESSWEQSEHYEKLDDYLRKSITPEAWDLHRAYLSFTTFVPVFAEIKLLICKEMSSIFSLNRSISADEAFKMVDFELNILFDVLYTKTMILQIRLGFILRLIYLMSSTGALLAFSWTSTQGHWRHHIHTHRIYCSLHEFSITYMLLLGAILADVTAVISHISSNWTLKQLTTLSTWQRLPTCAHQLIDCCLKLKMSKQGQGVKFIAQHSLLESCLKAKVNSFNACILKKMRTDKYSAAIKKITDHTRFLKVFWGIQKQAWEEVSPTWALVDSDLKELILSRLQNKRKKYQERDFKFSYLSRLVKKGASDLLRAKGAYEQLRWSLSKVELSHSLLIWHIATDILFHYYKRRCMGCSGSNNYTISKKLSDYMMHLLAMRSLMFQSNVSELRYKDTCFEALAFFGWQIIPDRKALGEAAMTLLALDNEARNFLSEVEGRGGKSVFFEGCELAKQLHSFTVNERWDPEELWEMICSVWLEMLFSAAYECDWEKHMCQVGQGGELLTHVALLMAHLGLSKHLRFTKNSIPNKPPWDWENLSRMAPYLA